MTMCRALVSALLVLLLSGCLQTTLIKAQQPQFAGNLYTLQTASTWNRITGLSQEIWTKDGLGLQELHFYNPASDGSPLFTRPDGKALPHFRAGMRANDVADLFAASMLANGAATAETQNLRPFTFGGRRGFRFEIAMVNQGGLRYRGDIYGAIINGKLHLIAYLGHEEFYFEGSRAEIEATLSGLKLRA